MPNPAKQCLSALSSALRRNDGDPVSAVRDEVLIVIADMRDKVELSGLPLHVICDSLASRYRLKITPQSFEAYVRRAKEARQRRAGPRAADVLDRAISAMGGD